MYRYRRARKRRRPPRDEDDKGLRRIQREWRRTNQEERKDDGIETSIKGAGPTDKLAALAAKRAVKKVKEVRKEEKRRKLKRGQKEAQEGTKEEVVMDRDKNNKITLELWLKEGQKLR